MASAPHDAPIDAASVERIEVTRIHLRSIVGGCVGNLIEWYDFLVYSIFSIYFASLFFPQGDQTAQLFNVTAPIRDCRRDRRLRAVRSASSLTHARAISSPSHRKVRSLAIQGFSRGVNSTTKTTSWSPQIKGLGFTRPRSQRPPLHCARSSAHGAE